MRWLDINPSIGFTGGRTWLRTTATVLGAAALVAGVVGLATRYVPISDHVLLVAAVASPYLGIGALFAVGFFALARRWFAATLAGVLAVVLIAVQFPVAGVGRPANTIAVRVMTANLYEGRAAAQRLVEAAESGADLLAVQELTPDAAARISAAGIDRVFPYRILDARPIASGGGLWSRFPVTSSRLVRGFELSTLVARVRVGGVDVDPTVVVAHLVAPWPQEVAGWSAEVARMRTTLQEQVAAADGGCVIAVGDFNSTMSMRPFRDLLAGGFLDAARQSRVWLTTYPANSHVPPYLGIDHILTNNCMPMHAHTLALPGSDHRALAATVWVPPRVGTAGPSRRAPDRLG